MWPHLSFFEHLLKIRQYFLVRHVAQSGGNVPVVSKRIAHASSSITVELVRQRIDLLGTLFDCSPEYSVGVGHMQVENDGRPRGVAGLVEPILDISSASMMRVSSISAFMHVPSGVTNRSRTSLILKTRLHQEIASAVLMTCR